MERQLRMGGGIMSLEPRQQYGLGSFVKSAVKGVTGAVKGAVSGIKDFAKSDLGKAAMLAAISFGVPGTGIGGLFGRQSMFGPAKGLFGEYGIGNTFGALKASPFGQKIFGTAVGEDMTRTGGLLKNKLFQGAAAGTVLGSVLGGGLPSEEGATVGGERNIGALRTRLEKAYRELRYPEEEIPALVEADLAEYTGGPSFAVGGRVGYAFGNNNPEQNAINAAGIMGLPLNQNPAGATELDMRDTGGFIPPVGVKEKEDDIPAMLSNNEFVFTADAVRGMGEGDVNVGAQRMYDMMKKLENGGRV